MPRYEEDCLCHKSVELIGSGRCDAAVTHLTFADHVHDFDAGQDDARTSEIIEPHHRFDNAFDSAMVLLNNVVQAFVLPHLDRR